jgi:catechol 2,3-dioxygenase
MNVAHPQTRIGHVHLHVADLERSLAFYRDILGFAVTERIGKTAVFLSAGGYHHHIGLNTWQGEGAPPAPQGHAGLYHFAILYPSRRALAQALKALMEAQWPIQGASDHGVSEAIYLSDPDNIGIELYWDRPEREWKRDGARILMTSGPVDIETLLKEAE